MLNTNSIASSPGFSKIHPKDSVRCADKVWLILRLQQRTEADDDGGRIRVEAKRRIDSESSLCRRRSFRVDGIASGVLFTLPWFSIPQY